MMTMDFSGRVCIVTGAGKGIGRETAIHFARAGAKVVLTGHRPESLKEAEAEVRGITDEVLVVVADVAVWEDVQRLTEETIAKFGRIDILINNAGMELEGPDGLPLKPLDITDSDYDKIVDINMKGQFNCMKAVLPYMQEKQYGRIVNLGSTTGIRGHYGAAAYCAAKAGVMAQTMVFAREFGKFNITVNCVAPGLILTPLHLNTPQETLDAQAKQIALGRPGKPADVAHVIMFFSSDELFVTGQTLVVDGGNTMR